jgi:hypothetical protein
MPNPHDHVMLVEDHPALAGLYGLPKLDGVGVLELLRTH